ncbi:Inner membrane protein YidH [Microbacterium sp. 8M]|jgi:putative membrane protein|uniref:YidH family protein n=1 Tax=Microbacterium sp. 8M TaxID=2653153 RepID=UPI0012F341FF|nr:DUF202 domain-containing protein [Microbacterium sp. 8M]VXB96742.1 Inner membrane protein YidH [Microbacterium sp. 8M]
MSTSRFPRRVYDRGEEPDARFTLANERTFLAWIRTSLALLAGGVALEALGLGIAPGYRHAASILLIVAGLLTPAQAWFGWMRTERALRESRPLGPPWLAIPLALVVVATAVLVLLGVLLV